MALLYMAITVVHQRFALPGPLFETMVREEGNWLECTRARCSPAQGLEAQQIAHTVASWNSLFRQSPANALNPPARMGQ